MAKDFVNNTPTNRLSVEALLENITQMNNTTEKAGLQNIYYKKPLIDGKTLCSMYNVQPGKIMKPLLDELTKFQILNPKASVDDCIDYMDNNKDYFLTKYN